MARWITNWPHGRKWGSCSAAMAAQIAADPLSRCQVALVDGARKLSRHILHCRIDGDHWTAEARGRRAVAMALRLSPRGRRGSEDGGLRMEDGKKAA